MKVFTKILGAFLLLGCLAYISFVFGKYVLSSSLLGSIPKSDRIINADNPTPSPASSPASSSDEQEFAPQVQMQVLPDERTTRDNRSDRDVPAITDDASDDSDASDNTSRKPKISDEGVTSYSHRRRSRERKTLKESTEVKKVAPKTPIDVKPQKKNSSSSSSAPIRRLNQEKKKESASPVRKSEKGTSSSSSGSSDAASISPIPKPE